MKTKTALVIASIGIFLLCFSCGLSDAQEQEEIINGYYKEIKISPLVVTKTGIKMRVGDELIKVAPDLKITICGHGPYDLASFDRIVGEKCQVFVSIQTGIPLVKSISLVCE